MESISQKDIEWLRTSPDAFRADYLAQPPDTSSSSPKPRPSFLRRLLWLAILLPLAFVLPFFILIRMAVLVHTQYDLNGWLSLTAGVISCVLLLIVYVFLLSRKARWRRHMMRYGSYLSLLAVLAFSMYGLFYLSGVHSKSEDIRQVYRSLHPILRVTVSTVSFADKDLLITDIRRTPEDYRRWGLTPLQRSMHYPQDDGFVYALDLRTIGNSELRNILLEYGFRAMGLQTIRHVGTADHLHVSLKKQAS